MNFVEEKSPFKRSLAEDNPSNSAEEGEEEEEDKPITATKFVNYIPKEFEKASTKSTFPNLGNRALNLANSPLSAEIPLTPPPDNRTQAASSKTDSETQPLFAKLIFHENKSAKKAYKKVKKMEELPGGSIAMTVYQPSDQGFSCKTCGKMYKHPSCLSKHSWEHTLHWKVLADLPLTKHQIVQMLEAAQILMRILNPSQSLQ